MLHKRLYCFYHFHRLFRLPTVRCVLIILACQGVPPCWRVEASEEARKPVVLLGHVKSRKNYVAGALLGTEFISSEGDAIPDLTVVKDKRSDTYMNSDDSLLNGEKRAFRRAYEKTICYDHPRLPCPLYNVRGFGKSNYLTLLQRDHNTQAAHASLQAIIKQPIQGLVLHVHYLHVEDCTQRTSLDVMDFLLPYFKDAAAVTKYLGPSVCLVITGFDVRKHRGFGVYDRRPSVRKKFTAVRSLLRSIQTCYKAFYRAKEGTQAYATLAKQKAFYDIFIKNAGSIKLDDDNNISVDDFHLDIGKIILFEPSASVSLGSMEGANTTPLEAAVRQFEGIPAATLAYDEEGHAHWLWAVPAIGAAAYGWSSSEDSAKDDNQEKKQSRTSRVSVRDDDDDDGGTDDAMLELLTSQSPQSPFDDVT